jgi:hypothetical protein
VVIGFFFTFIIGLLASSLINACKKKKTTRITNFDLFFPPIAKRMKERSKKEAQDQLIMKSNETTQL